MPPDRRLLREIRSAFDGMKRSQLEQGQWVQWYRFSSTTAPVDPSTSHPVYDTGPQRQWNTPITIPVYMGEYRRQSQNFDDDGLYLVDRVHLIMSYFAFFQAPIPDPDPYGQDHLNDRVGFDGRLFSVDMFLPRGRTASWFLTISVDLTEVAQEELIEDVVPPMFQKYVTAT